MIAYLEVSLIKTPTWWDFDKLDNISDLQDMYKEVYKFVESFRVKNGTSSNVGDSSATSGQETMENK